MEGPRRRHVDILRGGRGRVEEGGGGGEGFW